MKECTKCGETDVSKFCRDSRKKDGLQSQCKGCQSESTAKRKRLGLTTESDTRHLNSEKRKNTQKKWLSSDKGKLSKKKTSEKMTSIYPHKQKARRKLAYEIAKGNIIKPSICSQCGANDRKIHGHHFNYALPTEVVWCCYSCHLNIHGGRF